KAAPEAVVAEASPVKAARRAPQAGLLPHPSARRPIQTWTRRRTIFRSKRAPTQAGFSIRFRDRAVNETRTINSPAHRFEGGLKIRPAFSPARDGFVEVEDGADDVGPGGELDGVEGFVAPVLAVGEQLERFLPLRAVAAVLLFK